jgi:hypothetical protein
MSRRALPLFLAALAACASSAPQIRLAGEGRGACIEAVDLPAGVVAALAERPLSAAQWPAVFSVRVDAAATDAPAVLGDYRCDGGAVRFVPRFPLQAGVPYRATLAIGELPGGEHGTPPLERTLVLPATPLAKAHVVESVHPTAAELPENLLRFYLQFSGPMTQGEAYRHVRLLRADGRAVELPFLEIGEELWDPSGTRLTLLFDPGRIKRGLVPHDEAGVALVSGQEYRLVVDAGWPDARGAPLREGFEKRFRATAADRRSPDPRAWRLAWPLAGTRQALRVDLDEALDQALLQRMLRVTCAGREVPGDMDVAPDQTRWSFTPRAPWSAGEHELVVDTALEDLAGNSIARVFDADRTEPDAGRRNAAAVRIAFTVRVRP